jgi:hypothetical protein
MVGRWAAQQFLEPWVTRFTAADLWWRGQLRGDGPAIGGSSAQHGGIEAGVIGRRQRVPVKPSMGTEVVGRSDSNHEIAASAMCRLPALQDY